jgi:hypothetical protein
VKYKVGIATEVAVNRSDCWFTYLAKILINITAGVLSDVMDKLSTSFETNQQE